LNLFNAAINHWLSHQTEISKLLASTSSCANSARLNRYRPESTMNAPTNIPNIFCDSKYMPTDPWERQILRNIVQNAIIRAIDDLEESYGLTVRYNKYLIT
jgi:hypothetical protein